MTPDTVPADPALYGLEGRLPGSPCTTPCEPGCAFTCHERHQSGGRARHDSGYCDQIRLGRDVSEYAPPIRLAWDAEKRAAREQAEAGILGALREHGDGDGLLYGDAGDFTTRRPWYWRAWRAGMRLRGWDA